MRILLLSALVIWTSFRLATMAVAQKQPVTRLSIEPPPVASDESVKLDYDIVYVRAPRRADGKEATTKGTATAPIAQ